MTSAAYFFESNAYGGPGRYWVASFNTKGVTCPQPGAKAKVKGGVKRYSPGCVPCGYEVSMSTVSEPSPARAARMAAADAWPSAMPLVLAGPPGMAANAAL